MAETVESMIASMQRYLKEPIDEDLAKDVLNDAVASLWGSLVDANIGDYISQQPLKLTATGDPIPFDEFAAAVEFIRCYSMAPLCVSIHEHDQAAIWEAKAEKKRSAAILEVLHKSPRQTHVTRFDPTKSVSRNPRII